MVSPLKRAFDIANSEDQRNLPSAKEQKNPTHDVGTAILSEAPAAASTASIPVQETKAPQPTRQEMIVRFREKILSEGREFIKEGKFVPLSKDNFVSVQVSNEDFQQILEGIYLGRIDYLENIGRGKNPEKFTHVLTLAPNTSWNVKIEDIQKECKSQNIVWKHLGKTLFDRGLDVDWNELVHSCTFQGGLNDVGIIKVNNGTYGLNPDGKYVSLEEVWKLKSKNVEQLKVDQYFKPIFSILDKALFGDGKLLVHCYQGVSRSPVIIIAYLINRIGVTADQAAAFVCARRKCVDPKLMEHLRKYDQDLKSKS